MTPALWLVLALVLAGALAVLNFGWDLVPWFVWRLLGRLWRRE